MSIPSTFPIAGSKQAGAHHAKHTDAPFHERHELLAFKEVAEILKTSPDNLRSWRHQERGPEFFTIGNRLYTIVGDLRSWIRQQRLAGKPVSRPKGV